MNEFVAGFCQGHRGFGLAHADDVHIFFPKAHGKASEIAVACYQAEAVYLAGVEDIHCVDYHCHVGGIFPGGIGKLLYRSDGVFKKDLFFPAVALGGPVAVDAAEGGVAVVFNLIENAACVFGADVVCVY